MLRPRLLPAALLALASSHSPAQDLGDLTPEVHVVTDVALDFAGDDGETERFDLVLEGGRIRSIAPTGGELPAGASVVDGAGLTALPAFLDAWSLTGVDTPSPTITHDEPVDTRRDVRAAMRSANRKGIQPTFRAASALDLGADGAGAWRAAGFGSMLVAPSGELIAGRGALVATRQGPARQLVQSPEVFLHGTFRASGSGFPSTMMGYFAQLRQFFYDVEHHGRLAERYEAGRPDPRPVWDLELESASRLVEGRELYVVHADRASDIERWLRLADEFGLRIAIAGGREAWKHADLLAERGVPVFLDLDWGEEVDDPSPDEPAEELVDGPGDDAPEGEDSAAMAAESGDEADEAEAEEAGDPWHYLEPIGIREERRRLWEETRAGALALEAAGVQVLYGTGDRQPKDLVAALRELVELGADPATLHGALTSEAARFLGMGEHLGELAAGRDATLCLWTADPLDPEAKGDLAWMFVDGVVHEFDVEQPGEGPAEGVDATGTWELSITGEFAPESAQAILAMDEGGAVTGTYRFVAAWDQETYETAVAGRVDGTTLKLTGDLDLDGESMKITFSGELNDDAFSGDVGTSSTWGEQSLSVAGTRAPEHHDHEHLEDEEYACH